MFEGYVYMVAWGTGILLHTYGMKSGYSLFI